MNKKKLAKSTKGITLIALVITIIVLLILAGVTIAAISGNEGVLDKAQGAKTKTDVANAKEAAMLKTTDYVQEFYQKKYVTNDSSVAGISNAGEYIAGKYATAVQTGDYYIQKDGTTGKIKVSTDAAGSNVIVEGTIENNGTITWGDETPVTPTQTPAQIAATVNRNIGKQVEYEVDAYKKPWRVFYADTDYVFLITTDNALSEHTLGTYPLGTTKAGAYSNAAGVSSYGQTYNSVWCGKMSTPSSNERANAKATAYLCDPNNWTNTYARGTFGTGTNTSSAPTGTFAVGGPTKELLIKSWNAAYANRATVSGAPTGTATEFTASDGNVSDVGYAYNKPDELYGTSSARPITTSIVPLTVSGTSYGLYNPLGTSGNSYWLASPSGSGSNVCLVLYNGCVNDGTYSNTGCGVRPLVCIPTSSFDTTWIAK